MIKSLRIKNLATIEDLEIDLEKGFSIITGETGVGKSIIIDGIMLILGEKSSKDMIRTGTAEISVEAVFKQEAAMTAWGELLSEQGEDEIFVHRKIAEKKTGKGYLNGTLVPIKKLKELSPFLVDIYGQNDHVFLQQIEYQLHYLDAYANADKIQKDVAETARTLKRLGREKDELELKERDREQRLDFLHYQINEIEKAQLTPGEEESLRQERDIFKNAERIRSLVEEAHNIVDNEDASLSSLLSRLQTISLDLSRFANEFKETYDAVSQFTITIRELSDFLLKFRDQHTASPDKLEEIEERLSRIEALKRKYGNSIAEILSYLEKVRVEHKELSTSQEKLSEYEDKIRENFVLYIKKAQTLSRLRKKRALVLEKEIEREIGNLGMKKARFKIRIETTDPDQDHLQKLKNLGMDEVEFLISPNPGEDLKPLRRVASGGELSRIMLALKSIGKNSEKFKTLIFDEIDSGIGGKTAEFVARKLKGLAVENQVICITHLPQIASFATHHFKIEKKIEKNRTFTTVKKLALKERIEEIARLTAGSHISDAALQNAREMLERNLQ
ncbi:DNA repair protein RecN [Acidobacteriota bacterium]